MDISDKNLYEYIVNFADDRTVLNMLSVNKQFHNQEFFKRILETRYPLLLEFKMDMKFPHILTILIVPNILICYYISGYLN